MSANNNQRQTKFPRLLTLEVASLEDVYWLEDSQASKVLGKDSATWSKVRQKLPTSKIQLESLKADLWSRIVKSSQHQDAWTWGDVLVVSMSFAGLITLAAVTQPTLAPEARNSLLQYVTGKYLMPANCKVIWDWTDPHTVGDTMIFTVRFFQRNGNQIKLLTIFSVVSNIMGEQNIFVFYLSFALQVNHIRSVILINFLLKLLKGHAK